MATRRTPANRAKRGTKKSAAGGAAVRERVRDLSVKAFRDQNLSLKDVPKLVHEVLEGAVKNVDQSIPKSSDNVLREVFDGLSEGVHAIASAGSATAKGVRDRGHTIAAANAPAAAKRIRAANEEFLAAVRSFAGKASGDVRTELNALVDRAKRTKPKVTSSVRKAAKAADGRLVELSSETARAGVQAVRRAAGAFVMGASGFLEGLGQAMASRTQPKPTRSKAAARPTKQSPARKAKKKAATKKG